MHLISTADDLDLYKACERCFWMNYKCPAPYPAPAASLFEQASRHKIHEFFDKYRGSLPPDMSEHMEGNLLPDAELIGHWRSWQKGLRHSDTVMSAVLLGAMDDCLIQDNEYFVPIEIRLMSREPFMNEVKDRQSYLDGLTYLLTANGYKTLEFGYVICCYPQSVIQPHALSLKKEAVRVDTDVMRAERLFYGAAELLRRRTPPETDRGQCARCVWFEARTATSKS